MNYPAVWASPLRGARLLSDPHHQGQSRSIEPRKTTQFELRAAATSDQHFDQGQRYGRKRKERPRCAL